MTGLLSFWSKERGFGFVVTDKRESFCLHLTEIVEGPLIPAVGSLVEFDVKPPLPGKQHPNAVNAKITVASGVSR
jgi:cold shock CspA family protein